MNPRAMKQKEPILEVKNLSVSFGSRPLLRDISFSLYPHETLALVGESGSGKTITAMAIMNLFRSPHTRITGGQILFEGQNLVTKSHSEMQQVRGKLIAFIPQSPLSCLNPTLQIGTQLMEVMCHTLYPTRRSRIERACELLTQVGIQDAADRLSLYPHELSGGMRQRLLIAMALTSRPKIVIADEPTTALDVTIQAQVLDLLLKVQQEYGMSMLFITHDMGVVARVSTRVAVMYAGKIVEQADCQELFSNPKHPYTQALLQCLPRLEGDISDLQPISGAPPQIGQYLEMCPFLPRCPHAMKICSQKMPPITGENHKSCCWRHDS